MEILAQMDVTAISGMIREGGAIIVLAWFVWYFQRKWDALDRRHNELHNKTLSVVSTNSAAIAQMAQAVHTMRKEIRLCQIVRSGDLEAVKAALEESDQ